MGRFYASKYKNAGAKRPKKEQTAFGIKVNELCPNDSIACGVDKVVFAGEGAGIGMLDVNQVGNISVVETLHGHGDFIKNLEFSPFKKELLASTANDNLIKLWNTSSMSCTSTLHPSNSLSMTKFNPVTGNILASAEKECLSIYDLNKEERCLGHQVESNHISWSYDGRLVSSSSRDGKIYICDVRTDKVVANAKLFDANRDINHVWVGADKLVLCGFNGRTRSCKSIEISRPSTVISSIDMGNGSGSPKCLFDYDTGMLFLYCRGDQNFSYCEVKSSDVTITKNWTEPVDSSIKGICFAPKINLDVMLGEVNRLMVLQSTCILPTPYIVPRKSYNEFHEDLFPDTRGPVPGIDAERWLSGEDGYRELISLNPASSKVASVKAKEEIAQNGKDLPTATEEVTSTTEDSVLQIVQESEKHVQIVNQLSDGHSIYKNVQGKLEHKKYHFHGLKNIQPILPLESNAFQLGKKYIAVLMTGTGGRIGIIDSTNPGQNNTEQYELVNSGTPTAFQWDPFSHDHILAIGGDDALIKLWKVDDMKSSTLLHTFEKHRSKVILLSFHPAISGLLATCDFSGMLCLWDTHNMNLINSLSTSDEVLAMCWNINNGYILYTLNKTGIITIYDTNNDTKDQISLNLEIRAARMESTRSSLIISTLGSGNSRYIYLLSLENNKTLKLLASQSLGSGTSLCVPFVDIDTNVGYFAARGETTICPFEFRTVGPHFIIPCSSFSSLPSQYSLSCVNKRYCDVMKIEIAKFYKLSKDMIQLITFSVPRVRNEYFQDDLILPITDLSTPVLNIKEYLNKGEYKLKIIDLCPDGVQRNSEVEIVRTASCHSKVQQDHIKYKTAEAQRDELFNAFAEQVQKDAGPLEQDLMEGCDEDEWSD